MATFPDLFLYNTLSNRLELFQSRKPDIVCMYVCGPTVYGPVHIGNARPAVVFDLLYRLLKRRYGQVKYARNITDIDDKIIKTAIEHGETPDVVAERWRETYMKEMKLLGVLSPDFEPAATEHIPQMIEVITKLFSRGFAYEAEGHVLFHVRSFPDYGALSNRRCEEMLDGARVEVAPYKRDGADFVLWKPSDDSLPGWGSPWGRGRPGWHIECSAMAADCLGEEIDIHGGGQDLIFPHHENELAQSRCAHGTEVFANYWLHNGHVHMKGEKMSKSLNNVRLIGDALKHYPGEAIRLALLSTHYRRPMDWVEGSLAESKSILDKWYRITEGDKLESKPPFAVEIALADDLNTPAAIAALHRIANEATHATSYEEKATKRSELLAGAEMLGLLGMTKDQWFQGTNTSNESTIQRLIDERTSARKKHNFVEADTLRKELYEMGVVLEDTLTETQWRRV